MSPPNPHKIPTKEDLLGVTVLMTTALFGRQEFFRCSYFVYNNYKHPTLCSGSGDIFIDQVVRSILVGEPRILLDETIWTILARFASFLKT